MDNSSKIIDLSRDVIGRRKIKIALHEIYPDDTHWNDNGITYLEQYTRDNADTVIGMPICAEFIGGDKDVPFEHGFTGMKGITPVFEDSVQVGVCEDWSIEDIEIDGLLHKCLCATGYINESRYPNFVQWLEEKKTEGTTVYGSVEFVGTKVNDGEIIYDGGWKEQGRIPMIYNYSGYCIISMEPADHAAVVLELNEEKERQKIQSEEKVNFDDIFSDAINSEFNSKNDFDVFAERKPFEESGELDIFEHGYCKKSFSEDGFDNILK